MLNEMGYTIHRSALLTKSTLTFLAGRWEVVSPGSMKLKDAESPDEADTIFPFIC